MDIKLFDSTLRDGAQARGVAYTVEDKIHILKTLDLLGIDYVECGNPSSNEKDYNFFKEIKGIKLKHTKPVAFGSTRKCNTSVEEDVYLKRLVDADTDVVAIVGKSHDGHVLNILNTKLDENLKMIEDTISYLVSLGKEVIFDAEHFFDGFKRNPDYALETLLCAKNAGASVITLCDTNGGSFPDELGDIVSKVKEMINIPIGIHSHNDMNFADANSYVAVENGARLIQGTFIGFGERCGNANLSSIIPTLQLKKGYNCIEKSELKNLTHSANYIAEISNILLPNTLPYVGSSAFTHKGGMHVDGVNKLSFSFEHIAPASVGNNRNILFSDLAGRSALLETVSDIDNTLTKEDDRVIEITNELKHMEYLGYQYENATASLKLLVLKKLGKFKPHFKTEFFRVFEEHNSLGTTKSSSALVKIKAGEEFEITAAEGNGPVNALDNALRKALVIFYPRLKEMKLIDFKVRVVDLKGTTGATVRVIIESDDGNSTWTTIGVNEDIINASFLALVDSFEYKLLLDEWNENE